MTEAEWLTASDPHRMLGYLQFIASNRKLRLFACTVCRGIWEFIADPTARKAVLVAEEFADGLATIAEVEALQAAIAPKVAYYVDMPGFAAAAAAATLWPNICEGAIHVTRVAISEFHEGILGYGGAGQDSANQLRDLFGNPFRPITLDPAWLTANVVGLAQSIYDERAFDHLPILADALEDAGCTQKEMLKHCRQPGDHVRGCWLLDLLLAKE